MIQRSLVGELVGIPEGAILGHVDDVGLPMVRLHLLVDAVGLMILERQNIQFRAANPVDNPLAVEPLARLRLVQLEGAVLEGVNNVLTLFLFSNVGFFQYFYHKS